MSNTKLQTYKSTKSSSKPIKVNKFKSLNVVSIEEKDEILLKLTNLITNGIRIGKDIVVGYNSAMRLMEKNQASVVCIGKDTNQMLFKYISEVSSIKRVHLIIIPKLNQILKSILQLKSASCFALKSLVLNNDHNINNIKNIDTTTTNDNNSNHCINTNNSNNNNDDDNNNSNNTSSNNNANNNMIDNMKLYDINNEVMLAGIDNLRDYLLLIRNNNHIDINNKDNYY